uniref:Ycf1 n=1 Tax=Flabellia petiolata TaxID=189428 RepID=A0A386AX63_9CHLO|nr:hypothetical protein Ycf1 [Flabellia petiolata]
MITLNILKDGAIYFLSFQWINDFVKFPIIVAQGPESIFADLFNNLFNNPYPYSLSLFIENGVDKTSVTNSFFIGFWNCFFLYLPFSPAHLIWLRRVIVDGEWAGKAATIGLVCGNLSLLGLCLFGFRDFINTWFGLEPFSYFLGIWLIFIVIFEMTNRPLKVLKKSQKKELFNIFLMNFALVWTDQPGLYQFFSNLSLYSGVSPLDFEAPISFYFLGVVFGSICWASFISFIVLRLGYLFPRITFYKYPYSYWIRGFNSFCLIGCITLTLTTFHYYGFDYLFANPLGFTSQDHIWEVTTLPKLKTDTVDTSQGRLGEKSSYASLDTDLSLFDRARYGAGPFVEFHLESLNYKEEYAWRSRFDRVSSRAKRGGLFDKYLATHLGPVEEAQKKQKREKKRAQQIKKFQKFKKQQKKKNLEESNKYISIDFSNEDNEDEDLDYLIERFIEDYTAEANGEDEDVPDLEEEKMINFSAFSEIAKYGFDLFSMFEAVELDPLDDELEKEIKEKYSENLVYKFLVNFDISNFLNRQPKYHNLTSKDEITLFKNRVALGEYYDTLRSYSKLPSSFRSLFCGPKSYSNRIYNQQFKGTLKIVERLFSIHLEDDENIPNLPDINNIENEKNKEDKDIDIYLKSKKEPSVLKFDQPLYKKDQRTDGTPKIIHEQLNGELVTKEADSIPFIQEGRSLPFFSGWDNEQRKFIVTNRLLTREKTLSTSKIAVLKGQGRRRPNGTATFKKIKEIMDVGKTTRFKQKSYVRSPKASENKLQTFTFTTWPVSEKAFKTNPLLSRLYRTSDDRDRDRDFGLEYRDDLADEYDLFKYAEPLMEEETVIYDKLPSIVQRVELKNPEKMQIDLAPTRGGFVWPGNEPLKYKFQKFKNSKIGKFFIYTKNIENKR